MEKVNISLIIPCYNSEKYLIKNIESIVNQTYKNFEAIYINDGSTDRTLDILEKYKKNDDRIKIISIKNSGVSHARNIGIENALGKYIAFVDSDDYIKTDYLEKLYNNTENDSIDYVKASFNDAKISSKIEFKYIYKLLLNTYKLSNIWNCLIRLDIIKKYNIRFNEKCNYAEDFGFNIELLQKVKNFKGINYFGYYYVENPKSLTRFIDKEKLENKINSTLIQYKKLYSLFDKKVVDKRIEKEIFHIIDSMYYSNCILSCKQRVEIFREINKTLSNNKFKINSYKLFLLKIKKYILYDYLLIIIRKFPRMIKKYVKRIL